jgi:hypothetical protein
MVEWNSRGPVYDQAGRDFMENHYRALATRLYEMGLLPRSNRSKSGAGWRIEVGDAVYVFSVRAYAKANTPLAKQLAAETAEALAEFERTVK